MFENLRAIAVLACLVSTILFLVGGLTDHWAIDDNGHLGLWEYCDNSPPNMTRTENTSSVHSSTTTTAISSTRNHKDEDKADDEEQNCSSFGLTSIPAFFHIVRMLMVLSGIVLGWGILSGKNLRLKIIREDTFVRTHLSELAGIIACVVAYIGIILFADNFKSLKDEIFLNSRLGWSYHLLRTSLIMFFPTFVCMMAPTIHEKYKHHCPRFDFLDSICIRIGFKKQPEQRTSRSEGFDRTRRITQTIRSTVSDSDAPGNRHHGERDLSLQMSETDSDIFVVVIRSDDDGDMTNGNSPPPPTIAPGSDLPQYEDIASSSLPPPSAPPPLPPPSYDEVIAGNYLSFSSSPSSSNPNRESSTDPPPPSYDYIA